MWGWLRGIWLWWCAMRVGGEMHIPFLWCPPHLAIFSFYIAKGKSAINSVASSPVSTHTHIYWRVWFHIFFLCRCHSRFHWCDVLMHRPNPIFMQINLQGAFLKRRQPKPTESAATVTIWSVRALMTIDGAGSKILISHQGRREKFSLTPLLQHASGINHHECGSRESLHFICAETHRANRNMGPRELFIRIFATKAYSAAQGDNGKDY